MALQDPVAIYNAATNLDAHLVKLRLIEAGIETFVTEDFSVVGFGWLGTLPEIHKPQVWVSQSDVDRARRVLIQHEDEAAKRNETSPPVATETGPPIEVECEDCHAKTVFPANQRGTIQYCPACGEYLDVDDIDEQDPYWLESDGDDESEDA